MNKVTEYLLHKEIVAAEFIKVGGDTALQLAFMDGSSCYIQGDFDANGNTSLIFFSKEKEDGLYIKNECKED